MYLLLRVVLYVRRLGFFVTLDMSTQPVVACFGERQGSSRERSKRTDAVHSFVIKIALNRCVNARCMAGSDRCAQVAASKHM